MKKQILTALTSVFFYFAAYSQQTLFSENFDAASLNVLPANWTGTASGFTVENSNFSTGYTGATGLQNLVIRNTVASGIYYVETPSFSTINMDNITLSYGVRHTTNFPVPGSTVDVLEYSIDNGIEWNSLSFVQNPSNSVWALINDAEPIQLPTDANNQPNVKIRWGANITNNLDGSYRIDDIIVKGNDFTTSILSKQTNSISIFPNPFENSIKIDGFKNNQKLNVILRNQIGEVVFQQKDVLNNSVLNLPELLASGIYYITVSNEQETYTQRLIK
jgi:hypothetical protein